MHPNWWGQPPAILKGWIDRVLRQGVAYEFPEGCDESGVPGGLLKARSAVVFNTSNTPPEREKAVFGDPLELLWRNCVFQFCGVDTVVRRMFCTVAGSTAQQRAAGSPRWRPSFPPLSPGPHDGAGLAIAILAAAGYCLKRIVNCGGTGMASAFTDLCPAGTIRTLDGAGRFQQLAPPAWIWLRKLLGPHPWRRTRRKILVG